MRNTEHEQFVDVEAGIEAEIKQEARKVFQDKLFYLVILLDYFPKYVQFFLLVYWLPVFGFEIHRLLVDGKRLTENKVLLLAIFVLAQISFYCCLAKTLYCGSLARLRQKFEAKKRLTKRKKNGDKAISAN